MITVYFVRDGSKIRVDVPENTTLMEAAKQSHVPIHEIPADCGGSCACCTCHIHLTDPWLDKLGKVDYNTTETALLEYEKNYVEGRSRLACQIQLKPEHDGLVVNLLKHELL